MNLRTLFSRLLGRPPQPPHNPMDWRVTATSSKWETDTYCPQCKAWTEHEDRMADICGKCGYVAVSSRSLRNFWRSSRKIWNGTKWVWQHKYGNGPDDYTLDG